MKYLALVVVLGGCAVENQSEDYHASAADITLSQSSHPDGWARSECFACHIPSNLHLVNRLNLPSFPLARDLVERSGVQSCRACHGVNGVSP